MKNYWLCRRQESIQQDNIDKEEQVALTEVLKPCSKCGTMTNDAKCLCLYCYELKWGY